MKRQNPCFKRKKPLLDQAHIYRVPFDRTILVAGHNCPQKKHGLSDQPKSHYKEPRLSLTFKMSRKPRTRRDCRTVGYFYRSTCVLLATFKIERVSYRCGSQASGVP